MNEDLVPVALRWKLVCAGEDLAGADGNRWRVQRATNYGCTATNGEHSFTRPVKPEQATTVYLPQVELDCLTLLRGMLGARVESRRLNPTPATVPATPPATAPQVPATANVAGT